MKPFLITGCGRSGTRFISDLLTLNGVPTGWEATLNPIACPCHKAIDYPFLLRRLRLWGDANWLAVPYLRRIPTTVKIFHQVRHPLLVVRSFLGLRFFGDDYLFPQWRGDARHTILPRAHLPGLSNVTSAILRCLNYWVGWNLLLTDIVQERGFPYMRYQFEDLLNRESRQLEVLYLAITGTKLPDDLTWPENAHAFFKKGDPQISWADIPDGCLKDAAVCLAKNYGYEDEETHCML